MPREGLAIFAPVFVLAAWTFAVLVSIALRRFAAAGRGEVTADDFRLGESAGVPPQVRLANRNYMNLLELPVLFYAIVVIAYVTDAVSPLVVGLAWAFVALRIAHTLVHLLYNDVMHRLAVFAAGNGVLLVLWAAVGIALWHGTP